MRYIHFLIIPLIVIFICIFAKKKHNNNDDIPFHCATTKPIIIFDLFNVVFKENQSEFTKRIGYGKLASYMFSHWKNPGYRCLDMLEEMSKQNNQKPHCHITLQNRIMPRCLVELQEGKKRCEEVKREILHNIEMLDIQKYFSSAKEKNLMIHIMELVLNPDIAHNVIEPIKPTLQLIQQLKGKGHSVYLFANAPHELHEAMQKKYAHVLQLFDGILLSCYVQTVKPNSAIFDHLIQKHNLDPRNCILIDDLHETAVVAKELGMHAIVFQKVSQVKKELNKCGIRI